MAVPSGPPLSLPGCSLEQRKPLYNPPVCTLQILLFGPAVAGMAPSSPPALTQGSGARFLCHLLPTHCCMSSVCQPTPGGNTRSQGRGIEPRGESARLTSCPSSPPGINYPLLPTPTLECCPLGDLQGEGFVPVLSREGREDGIFRGRRMPFSRSAVFKIPINGTLCSLCTSCHSSQCHFFQAARRGSGPPQGDEGAGPGLDGGVSLQQSEWQ